MINILEVEILKNIKITNFKKLDENTLNEHYNFIVHNVENLKEIFELIKIKLNVENNCIIDIINLWYNENEIIQSFCNPNEPSKEIIVRRKIEYHENNTKMEQYFSYSFNEFDLNNNIEPYIFLPMSVDIFAKVIRNKFVQKGIITVDDKHEEMEYLLLNENENICNMLVNNILNDTTNYVHEVKIINLSHIISNLKENENIETKVKNLIENENENDNDNNNNTNYYVYTQHDIKYGIINCFCQYKSSVRNEIVEKIIGCETWGICYIGINDHNNTHITPIDLRLKDFEKIMEINFDNHIFKQNNPYFCNFYRELHDI
jgi:hypothetical protein